MSLIITKEGKLKQKRQQAPLQNFKYFQVKVDQVDENSRKISGYAAVFGNIDSAGDRIIKGAFAKSIQERGPGTTNGNRVILLWQHDMKEPIGNITLLKEDDFGLYFEALVDDVERGNQALTQLKSGTLDQFSIGYNYVWDRIEYEMDDDCFNCYELYLAEISPVSLSANPLAQFEGMKSEQREDEALALKNELEDIFSSMSMPRAFKLRSIVTKLLALAQTSPVETTKSEKRAASTAETTPGLNWGALSNSFQ